MNNLTLACELWQEYQEAKNNPTALTLDVDMLREALKKVVVNLANEETTWTFKMQSELSDNTKGNV